MVEKNFTIPINEQFDLYDSCPVCRLHENLEKQNLDYIMGAAMMEPAVRIESNKTGFCRRHYSDMLAMKNRLSLALMLESYFNELNAKIKQISDTSRTDTKTPPEAPARGLFGAKKPDIKLIRAVTTDIHRANDECFVCNRMAETLKKYCENIIFLWRTEPDFREKFLKQPEFCLNHASQLLKTAEENLNPAQLQSFVRDLFFVVCEKLDTLRVEVSRFCKSFDYRYTGEPLGEAKMAAEHSIEWLLGKV